MLNDIRLEVRRVGETVRGTGQAVNEHLPEIVGKARTTSDTLAALAEDVRQVRQLLGLKEGSRDKNLVAYANGVVERIEASGGSIGLKHPVPGKGLLNPVPAREWAGRARREALGLALLGVSQKEMATGLSRNWLRAPWYIQVKAEEPVPLLDWLKANHPPTRELWAEGK